MLEREKSRRDIEREGEREREVKGIYRESERKRRFLLQFLMKYPECRSGKQG